MTIQRYRPVLGAEQYSNVGPNGGRIMIASVDKSDAGDFVRYEDYVAEVEKLRKIIRDMEEDERDRALDRRFADR